MREAFTATVLAACGWLPTHGRSQDPSPAAPIVARLDAEDEGARQEAMQALTDLGARAVAPMIALLREADHDTCSRGQAAAIRVLGRLGAAAVPAVPCLLSLLPHRDDATNLSLLLALANVAPFAGDGTSIREAMRRLLLDPPHPKTRVAEFISDHVYARLLAARVYARTLLQADAPPPSLAAALRHDNPFVRELAIERIDERAVATEDCIDGLLRVISEDQPRVATCREPDQPADRLLDQTLSLDGRLHRRAAAALTRLAPNDRRSVAAHLVMLDDTDPVVVQRSVTALGDLGDNAAVPALLALLRTGTSAVRREAVSSLGRIGPAAKEAIPDLRRLLTDDDVELAKRARLAMRAIVE